MVLSGCQGITTVTAVLDCSFLLEGLLLAKRDRLQGPTRVLYPISMYFGAGVPQ